VDLIGVGGVNNSVAVTSVAGTVGSSGSTVVGVGHGSGGEVDVWSNSHDPYSPHNHHHHQQQQQQHHHQHHHQQQQHAAYYGQVNYRIPLPIEFQYNSTRFSCCVSSLSVEVR
jgi:hypothetical protein